MSGKKQEIVAFDIGSSKIAIVIGAMDNDGNYEIKNHFSENCDGIRSSLITNLSQAEESIINAVLKAEKTSKNFVKEISISICSSCAKSNYVSAKVRITGQSVTKQDVQKLINKALAEFSDSGQQVIHYFPIEFTLDNSIGISEPVGLLGKELSCSLHIISIDTTVLTNLIHCLNQCQIKVKDVVLSIYASSLGCTSLKDRQNGVLVVDFGARCTSFGVLFEDKLMYFGYVPIGSAHITSDIAKAFSISIKSSEQLKNLYGSSTILENSNMINLEDIDPTEFSSNQFISVSDLSNVVNPRVEEIFTLLKAQYSQLQVDDLIAQNMILTGQGSKLNNLAQTVSEIFSKTVKIDIGSQEMKSPASLSYTTAIGMLAFTASKKKLSSTTNINNPGTLQRMWSWFKENI